MKSNKSYLFIALIIALFTVLAELGGPAEFGNIFRPETASADELNRKFGRLSDGRAYRVDQNGLQLVDYIAELEVAKHDLERQVHALEDELMDKNSQIEAISKGKPLPRAAVKEQELGRPENSAALQSCQAALLQATTRANQLQISAQSNQQEIARLQSALRDAPAKIRAEQEVRVESEEHLQSAKQKISSQQLKIVDQEEKLAAQEAELKSQGEQIAKLEQQLSESRASLGASGRASLALKSLDEAAAAEVTAANQIAVRGSGQARTSLNRPSVEQLALARTELREELQKVQGLISQRKSLLDSASRRGPSVSIKVQPLVSKEGVSLDNLRLSVDRLNADSDIAAIRKGVNDIKALLLEDIGVLSRLGRI